MSSFHSIKVSLGEDLRRFAFDGSSFAQLQEAIRVLYNLQGTFVIKYQDEENDWITISSDRELAVAFQLDRTGSVLRVSVSLENGAVSMPPPVQAPMEISTEAPIQQSTPSAPISTSGSLYPQIVPPLNGPFSVSAPSSPQTVPPLNGPFPMSTPSSPQFANNSKSWKEEWKQNKEEWKRNKRDMKKNWKENKDQWKRENKEQWKQRKHEMKIQKKFDKVGKKLEHAQEKALKHGVARLVQDVTVPEGIKVTPGTQLFKTWRIRNESLVSWPQNYVFAFKKGQIMSPTNAVNLPKDIAPGEEFEISIPISVPTTPGYYMSVWRLIAGFAGKPFGRPFYVKMWACDPNSPTTTSTPTPMPFTNDTQGHLAELEAMGFMDRELNQRLLKKCEDDLERTVWKLLKKQYKIQKKEMKEQLKMQGKMW